MVCFVLATLLGRLQQDANIYPFPATESPSKRFVVRHLGADANDLFDQKSKKSVGKLAGFSGFEGENHGGMSASYSEKESWVAVIQMGKWEPQHLAIMNTSTGRQLAVLRQVQKDAHAFLNRIKPSKENSQVVFDVAGAKWSGNQVSFAVLGEIPKSETGPTANISLTYTVSASKNGIALSKAKGALLKESKVWHWKSES